MGSHRAPKKSRDGLGKNPAESPVNCFRVGFSVVIVGRKGGGKGEEGEQTGNAEAKMGGGVSPVSPTCLEPCG
jgi:hypothetical protein